MGNLFKLSNWKKTIYYFKKNGFRQAFYAVLERAFSEIGEEYHYEAVPEEELRRQAAEGAAFTTTFSILVPAYETKPEYLHELIGSVLSQTYGRFELIIADASKTDVVENVVHEYDDERIVYRKLSENEGISGNTNQALALATGDYVGLLDHDDLLTPDALYECAAQIEASADDNIKLRMLYSDEDKCDGTGTRFFEPNRKPDFNLDLILSNNYICHFLVMERTFLQELRFRGSMDGAQDYDLVLRAVDAMLGGKTQEAGVKELPVAHIPKVLYHWRCYEGSTSENPQSKRYAYEAGKCAVEEFTRARGWNTEVTHTAHLGFYRVDYQPEIFRNRQDVAVMGGKVLDRKNRIMAGAYDENGEALYRTLHKEYSGTMHRAACQQEAYAVDIRCMICSEEAERVMEGLIGCPYERHPQTGRFLYEKCLGGDADYRALSLRFCEELRRQGRRIVWDPLLTNKVSGKCTVDKR